MDAIRKFLLQGRYVTLFCRIEKLPSAPPDIYHKDGWINTKAHPDVQQVQQTTDGIFRIWRRIDDKGNQEQIIEAVRSQLEYFQATYPDEDIQPFIDGQIETIRELEDELFPNHNRGNINHYNGYKNLQAYKSALTTLPSTPPPPQPIIENPFSVLEWATVFYYADGTKLLTEGGTITSRLEEFMSKHQINTTINNIRTKYYEAMKRINKRNDYPIDKLKSIIPFLTENYPQTVNKVLSDIEILESLDPDY